MRNTRLAKPIRIGALTVWLLVPLGLAAQTDQGAGTAERSIGNSPKAIIVNTADPAVPGAVEVIIDVPSAFHFARYQRGEINGWRYVLYPDGSGTVMREDRDAAARYSLACRAGLSCQITGADGADFNVPAEGAARPDLPTSADGRAIAEYLAEWTLAGTGSLPIALVPVTNGLPDAEVQGRNVVVGRVAAQNENIAQPQSARPPPIEAAATAPITTEAATLAPLCTEPDPVMPSSCKEQSNEPAPSAPSLRRTDPRTANPTAQVPAPRAVVNPKPAPQTVAKRIGLDCALTGSTSLGFMAEGGTSRSIGKPRVSFGCNSKLTEKLSLRFSLLKYINATEQTADDPDFTYAFTYRYSDKLTFSYSNYSAQFGGANGGIWNALNDGFLRGSYKLPNLKLPNQKHATCSASLRLPNPISDSVNISCGYSVTDKFRIGGTLNLYAPHAQGDFDPDYTYTASYRVSDVVLISYSNYSNNRWIWNRGKNPGPGLLGGSLSVTYAMKF